ncbi:hypothetical protein [Streptomyces sp. NPDC051554]|uniref:hypothetical protein n=1 Tax=Streptomyces sp. NPDC051554 TaxID=3365656 RepID=UPI0037B5E3D0
MSPARTCRACRRPLAAPSLDGYGPKCRRKHRPPAVRGRRPRRTPSPQQPTLDDAQETDQ